MSALGQSVEDYLSIRRALGYKLVDEGRVLSGFAAFVDQAGAVAVTTDLAVAWAMRTQHSSAGWWARRLSMVRGFARYQQTIDPASEIPPVGLLPRRNHRPTPYLYSDEEITVLLAAARTLTRPLQAATYETLLGLLASTGMRIGSPREHLSTELGRDAEGPRSSSFLPSGFGACEVRAGGSLAKSCSAAAAAVTAP